MNTYLNPEEIQKFLPMSTAIELMREAFSAISSGEAIIPGRQSMTISEYSGNSLIMPCYLPGSGYYGIKIANVFLNNAKNNVPTIQSIYHLYNEKTGTLLLSMDGAMLTKIRTGAASGLATQLMKGNNSSVLAIFGTGVQAESHIEAMCSIAQIEKIFIFPRQMKNAEDLIKKVSDNIPAEYVIAESLLSLKEADIICTTTPSHSVLFQRENLKSGAHINAIGSFKPDMIEVALNVVADSAIVVDQYSGALEEAGEIIQSINKGLLKSDDLLYELGELVTKKKVFQKGLKSFSLFKSVGNALQDLICAKYIYEYK